MAKVIDREVLRNCDAVLDFHLSPWGSVMGIVLCGMDYPDPDMVRRCYEMALACGYSSVRKGKVVGVHPGPRSLAAYASAKLGIPSANVDVGGAGFGVELERNWLDHDIRAVKNVMRYLGILDEPLEKPDRILVYGQVLRANPSVGGLLVPERDPDELGREVEKGELLGRIISPYTFEELERLEAPCDGWLAYFARSYPIRPGDWAFGVACTEGAEWVTP
jgi:predicted deacylase